jgi:hypothetical protein
MLSLLQPLAVPAGMRSPSSDVDLQPLVGTSSTRPEQPQEAKLSALRKTLFRTGQPLLLSRELPQIPPDPPGTVSTPAADDLALRQLHVQPTGFTPYDRYLGVVRNVMTELPARKKSVAATCSLLRTARSFRYSPGDPYRADSPAVTAARKAGDCKAKALWLYDQLGDSSVLYVIGKVSRKREEQSCLAVLALGGSLVDSGSHQSERSNCRRQYRARALCSLLFLHPGNSLPASSDVPPRRTSKHKANAIGSEPIPQRAGATLVSQLTASLITRSFAIRWRWR